jgi:hypothetical protein
MNTKLLCSAAALLAGSLLTAVAAPGDDITNAVNSLAGKSGYSWKSTVVVPEGTQFRPGDSSGKTEKDGYTDVKQSMMGNDMEIIFKGDKVAISTPDNGWQSPDAGGDQQGPGQFMARMARGIQTPVVQAAAVAAGAGELKVDGDVISGNLTEAGAKALLAFRGGGRRGGAGGNGPDISNAKGSVKFWIKDGTLAKYEFKVTGAMSFNGNDMDIDRDTTVEITDVGTTKVTVPADAQKILDAKPAAAPAAN